MNTWLLTASGPARLQGHARGQPLTSQTHANVGEHVSPPTSAGTQASCDMSEIGHPKLKARKALRFP